ncbi:maleylpyruvate isomerase, partial [Phycicoccus sp. CMS6Z-2]|nr:maleylpyruvate isomerase [Phycicoccus flavus]
RTGGPATVDAATYWTAFASLDEGDPVEVLLARRRRSDAYRGPASAVRELGDVGGTLRRICEDLPDGRHAFQGQVLTSGDLLATWAVETAVHHLDLLAGHPAPESALDLARRTCEALLGEPLPTGWADTDAVLVATGRVPVPDDGAALAGRLPVLG